MKKPGKKTQSTSKTKSKKAPAAAERGCCTLIGEGPDEQHEGLTREACRLLAARKNRNFQWVAGLCAEPD